MHLLFGLSRTRSTSEVVETVKTGSSKWIKTKGAPFVGFHWQAGYGAFSVSQSETETVVTYIKNQARHHQKMTFQEEYRRFLERHQSSTTSVMSGTEDLYRPFRPGIASRFITQAVGLG